MAETKKTQPFIQFVWDTFQSINLSGMVEKKLGLSYLSWARVHMLIMEYFPESTIDEQKEESFDNGEMDIVTTLTIRQGEQSATRTMRLPVMNHKNQPIRNPDRRAVNDSKMRCFVKCAAMFGLGITLYCGEDIPTAEELEKQKETKRRQAEREAAEAERQNHLNKWTKHIGGIQNLEQLNAALTEAVKLDNNDPTTRQIKAAIMAQASALGFEYDKENKTFTEKAA